VRRLYTARTAERVDVFDDEEALFAEIEGKSLPQAEVPQETYRTDTGTVNVENKDKDWIQKNKDNRMSRLSGFRSGIYAVVLGNSRSN